MYFNLLKAFKVAVHNITRQGKRRTYYPSKDTMESGVKVKLRAILDKTIARLSKSLRLKPSLDAKELTLICKWCFKTTLKLTKCIQRILVFLYALLHLCA